MRLETIKRMLSIVLIIALLISIIPDAIKVDANTIQSVTIDGVVKDEEANPLENVNIKLCNNDNNSMYSATTDSNGEFSLEDVISGDTYNISIEKEGFVSLKYENITSETALKEKLESIVLEKMVNVTFVVKDKINGNKIENATINIKNGDDSETSKDGRTDSNGEVSFLIDGSLTEWKYTVEKTGYIDVEDKEFSPSETNVEVYCIPEAEFDENKNYSGIVIDKNSQQPIENASIILTNQIVESEYYPKDDETGIYTDENGRFTINGIINNHGDYKIKITASGYESYDDVFRIEDSATNEYQLVRNGTDATFAFLNCSATENVKYGENNNEYDTKFIAKSENQVNGKITYSSSNEDIATIDKNSGKVTIVGCGSTTISATIDSSENYFETTVDCLLNVEKNTITISFAEDAPGIITFGLDSYNNGAIINVPYESYINISKSKIKYAFSDGSIENDIAVIDTETGDVNFKKPGNVTVLATYDENDYYKTASAEYSVESVFDTESDVYVVENQNSRGWNNDNITISAKTGYKLSKNIDDLNTWEDKIESFITEDGEYDSVFFALNSNTKKISKINCELKKDSKIPTGNVSLLYQDDNNNTKTVSWDKLITSITYKYYSSNKIKIESNIVDELSGILNKYYYIDKENSISSLQDVKSISEENWKELSDESYIYAYDKQVVYVKAYDNAGNVLYISTDGVKFDDKVPDINISPSGEVSEAGFYSDDIELNISVTDGAKEDEYTASGIKSITYEVKRKINNVWKVTKTEKLCTEEDGYPTNVSKDIIIDAGDNNSQNVIVSVFVEDKAGNNNFSTPTTKEFKIDIDSPKISKMEVAESANEKGYYKSNVRINYAVTDLVRTGYLAADVSGIKEIEYIVKNDGVITQQEKLYVYSGNNSKYQENDSYTVEANKNNGDKITTYIVVTDLAGNSIISNVIELKIDTEGSDVTITEENNQKNIIFNKNVTLVVDVKEKSGIEKVTYAVYNKEKQTQTGNIYPDSFGNQNQILSEIRGYVVVLSDINNSKNVKVIVKVTDIAGNQTEGEYSLEIDDVSPEIALEADKPNDAGYYNKDVSIKYNIKDVVTDNLKEEDIAGLKNVEYYMELNGKKDESIVLFEKGKKDVTETTGTILIDSKKYNSDDVKVVFTATDNANNVIQKIYNLKIDVTRPEITVSYDNNSYNKIDGERGYFGKKRVATVTIKERTSTFEKNVAKKGIVIKAIDKSGKEIKLDTMPTIGQWITKEGETPDSATHMLNITYAKDANYIFSITYSDKAGNKNKAVDYGESVAPKEFTIDKTKPTGTVVIGEKGVWKKLIFPISYKLYSNKALSITGTVEDKTSPTVKIKYYKVDTETALTREDLERVVLWNKLSKPVEIKPNEKAVVYFKLEDYAGNVTYLSSNGIIMDNKAPSIQITEKNKPKQGIYSGDVNFEVEVNDIIKNNAHSGIQNISYEVYSLGNITKSMTTVYDTKKSSVYSKKVNITVDSMKNNSNNVTLVVWSTDMAGNQSQKSYNIKIDVTNPTVSVSYDNNGDKSASDNKYFKNNRTATIRIKERNFDPTKVDIKITNTTNVIPSISEWKKVVDAGDDEGTTYETTLVYSEDGDYTFDIMCEDIVGNKMVESVDYGKSVAPTEFTIDKTNPELKVTYDNENALNGNYYAKDRTATIVINEHNFDESRLKLTIKSSNDGIEKNVSKNVKWISEGDIHRTSVVFDEDAMYSVDISYTDIAGNESEEIKNQTFYIDKTEPSIIISGVKNQSANKEDTVGLKIETSDINFESLKAELYVVTFENGKQVKRIVDGDLVTTEKGQIFQIENLIEDGIYILKCKVNDKAGNTFNKVTIEGNEIERTEKDEIMVFSVNRKGSTFSLGDYAENIVSNRYYVKNVENDFEIVEINVDPLEKYDVICNKVVLEEGKQYTVEKNETSENWCKYVYKLNNELFEKEGVYEIVIESKDKTETTAYSDVKNVGITFVVDKSAPAVTIRGLVDEARYQTTEQKVVAVPTDTGSDISEFSVTLLDEDGNVINKLFEKSGDELSVYLKENDGKIEFVLPEGIKNQVMISCSDSSSDENGNKNVWTKTFKNVTVSSSGWVIFYTNTPLLIATIAGSICVISIAVVGIIFMRKRRLK